jgi:hypothetical protein
MAPGASLSRLCIRGFCELHSRVFGLRPVQLPPVRCPSSITDLSMSLGVIRCIVSGFERELSWGPGPERLKSDFQKRYRQETRGGHVVNPSRLGGYMWVSDLRDGTWACPASLGVFCTLLSPKQLVCWPQALIHSAGMAEVVSAIGSRHSVHLTFL